MRVWSLAVTSLALVASSLAVGPASAAARTWRISPQNPVVSWFDPFAGPTTHTAEVEVSGVVHDEAELELTVQGTPDAEGRPPWSMLLIAPLDWFARPRSARLDAVGAPSPVYFVVFGDMFGCNNQHGRIDVHDVALDDRHRVTRMRFDFQVECDGAAFHGQVAWGQPTASVLPEGYTWPAADVDDRSAQVYFQMPNAAAWSGATPRLAGRDPGDFEVAGDLTCHPGPTGSFCRVPVTFAPTAAGHRQAVLVLETPDRTATVPLEGIGNPGAMQLIVDGRTFDGTQTWHHDITNANGSLDIGSRMTGTDYVNAYAVEDLGAAYDITVQAPRGERFVVGRTYVDPGDAPDDLELHVSYRPPGEDVWRGCGSNTSGGQFTFRQLHRPVDAAPAYALDFLAHCGAGTFEGTLLHGARADVTDPGRVGRLRVTQDGELRWASPGDAVRTVVRVRRGGLASSRPDDAELLYSGPGERVRIPGRYAGRATSYAVFTLDAAGNISSPRTLLLRGRTSVSTLAPDVSGGRAVAAGTVVDAAWRYRLTGREVVLQARRPGERWRLADRGRVDVRGRYRLVAAIRGTRELRVHAPGTSTHLSGTGPVRRARVS